MKNFWSWAFLFMALSMKGQQLFLPLDHDENMFLDQYINNTQSNFHTSVKPYFYQDVNRIINLDSIDSMLVDTNRLYLLPTSSWAKFVRWSERKLLDEDLVKIDSGAFKIRGNILLGLESGRDQSASEWFWRNTRGYWISGSFGKKVFFETALYENQAKLLSFVGDYAADTYVLPGQGRFKEFKDLANGADWAFSNGAFGFRPNRFFTLIAGHGKNFIGDGYRSLLLSDNAFNYPYIKLETTFWNIKYVNLWAQLSHIGFAGAGDQLWDTKYLSAHYLSWNVTKRLNLSIYESVSWVNTNGRGIDWNYLNPIILYRPVEWQNGSMENVLLGASGKFKITDQYSIYGQFVLDDLNIQELKKQDGYWGNKYGLQLGVKGNNIAGIYGLSAQLEYNVVRPYTYTHFDSINAYTHMNEPLAHPLGANLQEAVAIVRYKYKRHRFSAKAVWSETGLDTSGVNHGGNIFLSYNTNRLDINGDESYMGNTIAQGRNAMLNFSEIKYGYLVNPRAKLYFEFGLMSRSYRLKAAANQGNMYWFAGLRTSLSNFYYDYF